MQFKTDEQLRKYLTKKVRNDVQKERWGFNGIKFRLLQSYFEGDFCTHAEYSCDLNEISVSLTRWCGFTRSQEIVAEEGFSGKNAISECISWVVDRLVEIYKLLNERTAPYANNKALYDFMINRPIILKEAK